MHGSREEALQDQGLLEEQEAEHGPEDRGRQHGKPDLARQREVDVAVRPPGHFGNVQLIGGRGNSGRCEIQSI